MKIEATSTIGGAVIRLDAEARDALRKGIERMDQTFIGVGPVMVQLAKALQGLSDSLPLALDEAGKGMTPDGGYRAPEEDTDPVAEYLRGKPRNFPGPY